MKKRKSMLVDDMEHCIVCGTTRNIHIHHVIQGTANRKKSDKYDLVVPLCAEHHNMSNNGVHFNKHLDTKLKKWAQRKFEEKYSHELWMATFHRNYL